MYRCLNCGNLFEEGEQIFICEGVYKISESKQEEDGYYVSPCCNSDFERVNCRICGTPYGVDATLKCCDMCIDRVKEKALDFFTSLPQEERQLAYDMIDEGCF